MEMRSDKTPRRGMRRVVVVVPSGFTLGNLFFGFWAIISGVNGDYIHAGWFILFAGICDGLDGRVARASKTGSRFGAELDSLIDVISFGVAPAVLIYLEEFSSGSGFAWVLCFLYVVATALRLARYNVHAAMTQRTPSWFTGLPSPAAGMTLGVYYAFSQTDWYRQWLGSFNAQHIGVAILMMSLAGLMVSNVKYPRFPSAGFRTPGQLAGLAAYLLLLAAGIYDPERLLFPIGVAFAAFGVLRAMALMLADRGDNGQPPLTIAGVEQRSRRIGQSGEDTA
jgi:CDP-diacylglycerol---serine O-phosphatidyltransferase